MSAINRVKALNKDGSSSGLSLISSLYIRGGATVLDSLEELNLPSDALATAFCDLCDYEQAIFIDRLDDIDAFRAEILALPRLQAK